MYKNLKLKKSREFLKNYFPENILPFKNLIEKDKRYIRDKLQILKRAKRRIKKVKNLLQFKQKQYQFLNNIFYINYFKQNRIYAKGVRKTSFLFSSTQIKNDFLRNQNGNRPTSDFLLKIKEKKKFSFLYGNFSKKYYKKVYLKAVKTQGSINENLITQFETRLDTILYRICFAKNISAARQIINHNLITLNGVYINIPSYQVKPGDFISVDKKKKKNLTLQILKNLKQNINKRRSRLLLSTKILKQTILYYLILTNSKKFIPNFLHLFQKKSNKKRNIRTIKGFSLPQSKRFSQVFRRFNTKKTNKLYNKQYKKKRVQKYKQFSNKRDWNKVKILFYLIYFLQKINMQLNHFNILSKKELKFLDKKRKKIILYLKLKTFFFRKRSRIHSLWSMRFNPIKPLHVEVSYKIMSAVLLYAPQKIVYPTILNIDLFSRSLAKK